MNKQSEMPKDESVGEKGEYNFERRVHPAEVIIENIKAIARFAPERIQIEMNKKILPKPNPWISSIGTDVQTISLNFETLIMGHPELKEKYTQAEKNRRSLLERYEEVRNDFGYDKEPPQEVKDELLAKLYIFAND